MILGWALVGAVLSVGCDEPDTDDMSCDEVAECLQEVDCPGVIGTHTEMCWESCGITDEVFDELETCDVASAECSPYATGYRMWQGNAAADYVCEWDKPAPPALLD